MSESGLYEVWREGDTEPFDLEENLDNALIVVNNLKEDNIRAKIILP